ncbi:MAG: trehalose-phosphatase [Burkholderiaceae bacterium]
MRHLFTPEGEAALAATMHRQPLLAFDFDGTLAPIVARPDDARVSQAIARRLDLLGSALPLAIISGRTIDDVRSRLAFEPRFIIGNHGAEDPFLELASAIAHVFDPLRMRLQAHAQQLEAAGVAIEDKLQSLALHYRLARDRERAIEVIQQVLSGLEADIEAYAGKLVVNIVARNAPDKADAVASLVRRSGVTSAIFMGDDLNDEPVFQRAEPLWLTVKVGRDVQGSQAMFYLDNFGEVASVLDRMLTLLPH